MKSIVFFISNDLASDQRMQRIANSLVDNGWQVRMIGTRRNDSPNFFAEQYVIQRIHIRPEKGIGFYTFMNIYYLWISLKAKETVFYAVDLDTLPAIRIISWLRRKTFIWDSHEIFTAMPELYSHPFKRKVWRWMEQIFSPGILNVCTVTQGVSDYLHQQYALEPVIIHNYPDIYKDDVQVNEKFESKVLLFQGALNEGRGLNILINTMPLLDSALRLEIAGAGPLESELRSQVNRMGLNDRITFLGRLSPLELKDKATRVFIGISLLDAQHQNSYVSLANKNLDYIMAGIPAITMNFPEYRAINEQWKVAILLSDLTTTSLREAILQLANDQSLYTEMHQACKSARKMLNWNNESKKLIDFIEQILPYTERNV